MLQPGTILAGDSSGLFCGLLLGADEFIITGLFTRESRLGGKNPPSPPFTKRGLGGFESYFQRKFWEIYLAWNMGLRFSAKAFNPSRPSG